MNAHKKHKQKYDILTSAICMNSVDDDAADVQAAGMRQDSKKEIIKDWLPAKNRHENHPAAKSDLHLYNYDNEVDPG